MKTVLVSFVGFRPLAVASALAGWAARSEPADEAVLLHTPQASPHAIVRLAKEKGWVKKEARAVQVGSTEWESLGQQLQGPHVVFAADAGLGWQVIDLYVCQLRYAQLLHVDDASVWVCTLEKGQEQWEDSGMPNLGLDSVRALHDDVRLEPGPNPDRARLEALGVRVTGDMLVDPTVHVGRRVLFVPGALCERRGRVRLLAVVDDPDAERRKRLVRRLLALLVDRPRRFEPRITIVSRDPWVGQQKLPESCLWLNPDRPEDAARLKAWPGPDGLARKSAPVAGETTHKGAGGNGPVLGVVLGRDPSATLVSLATHKPKTALVFYDAGTPEVANAAERLGPHAHRMPVGECVLIPTDHLGRGILARLLKERQAGRVDISPGTNAQGCALARARIVSNGAWEIWSLDTARSHARCLMGPQRSPLMLEGPPVTVQAGLVGGPLQSEGYEPSPGGRKALSLLAKLLRDYLTKNPNASLPWADFGQVAGLPFDNGTVRFQLAVRRGSQHATGDVPVSGGHWFEAMVASAFLEAGAKEARVGVKWGQPRGASEAEADVVVRWGHRYLVVETKVGQTTQSDMRASVLKLRAVASARIGGQAVSLLVAPVPVAVEGVSCLTIADLAEPDVLCRRVEEILASLSTTRMGSRPGAGGPARR